MLLTSDMLLVMTQKASLPRSANSVPFSQDSMSVMHLQVTHVSEYIEIQEIISGAFGIVCEYMYTLNYIHGELCAIAEACSVANRITTGFF